MKISLGLPPGPQSRDLALVAEELGYDRVWIYDSAALYEDVWVHIAMIAEATERIGLGTAVLVPNLRHVMTTASAIATIERLAPGRLACGVGTGFTARLVLNKPPLPWSHVRKYVEQLRGLLRGDVVDIDGETCQMIHHPQMAQHRPIDVPILLSAFGPKGKSIAEEIADGWIGVGPPPDGLGWTVQMVNAVVLNDGESARSQRVIDAVGPWLVMRYHRVWTADQGALDELPGGSAWRASVQASRPEGQRHLVVHEGALQPPGRARSNHLLGS